MSADRQIMYREALNEALREEMLRDETVAPVVTTTVKDIVRTNPCQAP